MQQANVSRDVFRPLAHHPISRSVIASSFMPSLHFTVAVHMSTVLFSIIKDQTLVSWGKSRDSNYPRV